MARAAAAPRAAATGRPRNGGQRGRLDAPALVRLRPGSRAEAIVSCRGRTFAASLGARGIASLKREGDGASPRARIVPLAALTRDRTFALPLAGLPERAVRARDGWCDDPASARYNAPLALPRPASHETMMRDDGLYDVVVVTDHNSAPRVRGGGSAIFLHMARENGAGTLGCIAFPRATWRRGAVPLGPYLVGVEPRPLR